MTDVCTFCQFAHGLGAPPGGLTWCTSDVFSFTPLNPVTPGHRLFVPADHVPDASADPQLAADVFEQTARYAAGSEFNIITSRGGCATQTVFHLHVHVVPRTPGDGLRLPWSPVGDDR